MDTVKKATESRAKIYKAILFTILGIFAIGQLFPLIWLLDFSLNKSGDLFVSNILKWPVQPQFQNYVHAWHDGKVGPYLLNSIFINAIAIVITVMLSLTLGYAFTRMKWKLRGITMTVMLLGMMIPIHATLIPNFIIFNALNVSDSYLALIIPYVAFRLPLGIFIMAGFLKTIPSALEESAIIDGCGVYRTIFQIVMPITKPALVTVTIMTFLDNWNEFIMACTYLSSDKYRTIPFAVMNFAGPYAQDYAAQFAVMVLAALPALVIYFLLNEQITKGVTVGAMKG